VRVLACYLLCLMGRWKLICTKQSERNLFSSFTSLVSPLLSYSPSSNAKIVGQRLEGFPMSCRVPRPSLQSCIEGRNDGLVRTGS
jgi:hypothetical protein